MTSILIVAVPFLLVFALAIRCRRYVRSVADFLVAGRCVSSDRAANSGIRVQAACMATGQAAGEAAALAASCGLDLRDLPVGELRRLLARTGHIVPK